MPWQHQVADVALERDPLTGLYVYGTVIVTVQRQAGKTTLVLSVGTHRCLTRDRARVWYTAQTGKDAGDWFREEARPVFDTSLFRGRFKTRMSAGSEGLTWQNGSTFRCFPPLRDGLHGKQSDLVFPDEAWAHDEVKGDELKQAIRPTQATRPGAQVWPMSTAGDVNSAYLRSYVELGRASVAAGRRSGVAYFEFGIPDDVDPEDIDTVAAWHPAVGFTITKQALYDARDEMKPGEFARAYGNRWTTVSERVIPAEPWNDARVPADEFTPPKPGQVALAISVAIDRSEATITAAWRDSPAGPIRVDVLERHPGTAWLADRLAELRRHWRPRAIGYNRAGPAVDIADQLHRDGVTMTPVDTVDYAAACMGFLADVVEPGRLVHDGKPALESAVESAGQRVIGERWAWSARQSAGSISALEGVTVARWVFDHAKANKPVVVVARRRRSA